MYRTSGCEVKINHGPANKIMVLIGSATSKGSDKTSLLYSLSRVFPAHMNEDEN